MSDLKITIPLKKYTASFRCIAPHGKGSDGGKVKKDQYKPYAQKYQKQYGNQYDDKDKKDAGKSVYLPKHANDKANEQSPLSAKKEYKPGSSEEQADSLETRSITYAILTQIGKKGYQSRSATYSKESGYTRQSEDTNQIQSQSSSYLTLGSTYANDNAQSMYTLQKKALNLDYLLAQQQPKIVPGKPGGLEKRLAA